MAFLLFFLLVAVSTTAVADVFEGAEWLRDPAFDGVKVIGIQHKQQTERPALEGPRNVHTLFRKVVTLSAKPTAARLYITADDYCKLYINGAFAFQGPEPGYPFAYPYCSMDVTDLLHKGDNVFAAHVYYQGLCNRVWNSANNRSGFMLALNVTFEDGRQILVTTDDTWRCLTLKAFPTGDITGYETQFLENIDLRAIPKGWREGGFDDSEWAAPLTGRQDHQLVEQVTPPLEHWIARPVLSKQKAEGHYFYDFGTVLVGHTRVRAKGGQPGHVIEVRHGEELLEPDAVRYEMRANCRYQEFPVLSGSDDTVEFYDYRCFRYIEILNAPSEPEVWVDVRHHPFDPAASRLDASDDLLSRIWQLCRNGVRYGSQGGFLDCPSREKGQYLGDAFITSHSHLVCTGDPTLTRKALTDFQLSQRICPGLMAVAPGSFMQEIAEYSLQWPMMLRNYLQYTGDFLFTEKMVEAVFPGLFDYFARFESEAGLLTNMTEKWVLVDWPKNLRDDYDYEYAKHRENAVLNAFYYAALCAAAEICREVGLDARPYEAKAERVKDSFVERLLNRETGLFLDAPGSSHSSLHANALPVAFGLAPAEVAPNIIALIREKRLSCGVYIAPFVIEACYEAGASDLAYDLITSHDKHSWREMLTHGATTCMEAWGPDQKWNTSWCHPWSSSPVYLISERVMGLRPGAPGWRTIRFEPHLPPAVEHAAIAVPIPGGSVTVQYDRSTGFRVTTPPGVPVEVKAPEGARVEVCGSLTHAKAELSDAQRALLEAHGWREWVGDKLGVWISMDEQVLRLIEGGEATWQARCATAANGAGSEMDSNKTPLGWHSVVNKVGDDAIWGRVFRSRAATGQVWRPGDETDEDLVLTRVLVLAGEEPGLNQGGKVDSFARNIYIHGTNAESDVGTPSSHGCIRLRNDDVIEAFERIPEGACVLITEESPS